MQKLSRYIAGLLMVGTLLFPSSAFAAIAFTVYHGNFGGSSSTVTFAFDFTGIGTNPTLVCFAASGDASHDIHATGMTWNGVAMTQLGTTGTGGVNGTENGWVLAGASAANANLVTTFNSSVAGFGAAIGCSAYSGTSVSNPTIVTSPTTYTGNFSLNITTAVNNSTVVFHSNYGSTDTGTNSFGTTFRGSSAGWSGDIVNVTPAGVSSPGVNTTASSNQAVAMAIVVEPFAAAPVFKPKPPLATIYNDF